MFGNSLLAGWHVIIILVMLMPLIIAVVALIQVWRSPAPQNTKLLWMILVVVAPLIGAIIWWAVGKRAASEQSVLDS